MTKITMDEKIYRELLQEIEDKDDIIDTLKKEILKLRGVQDNET